MDLHRDFDLEALDEYGAKFGEEPYVGRIVFAFFSLTVCVIAMNALITYMGESFAKVNQNLDEELLRQRAGLLIELIALEDQNPAKRDAKEKINMWTYCLAWTADVEIIESADDQEEEQQKQQKQFSELGGQLDKQQQMVEECKRLLSEAQPAFVEHTASPRVDGNYSPRVDGNIQGGSIKSSVEALFKHQEEKLTTQGDSIKSSINDLFERQESSLVKRMEEKLGEHQENFTKRMEEKLGEHSSSSQQRQQKLEGKLDAALKSFRAINPLLPPDVRERLDRIQKEHTNGQFERAREFFQDLVDWYVVKLKGCFGALSEGTHLSVPEPLISGTAAVCPRLKKQGRGRRRRDSRQSLRNAERSSHTRSRPHPRGCLLDQQHTRNSRRNKRGHDSSQRRYDFRPSSSAVRLRGFEAPSSVAGSIARAGYCPRTSTPPLEVYFFLEIFFFFRELCFTETPPRDSPQLRMEAP